MSKAFQNFLNTVKEQNFDLIYAEVRQGSEVLEEYVRFAKKPRFESFSLSKTFVSAGIGLGVEEGFLTLDEKIWDTFSKAGYDCRSEYAKAITVRDLLTMTAGQGTPIFFRDSYERAHEKDWVRYFFEQGDFAYAPGTNFLYNNVYCYIAAALLEEKCGQNMLEFLRERLFEPLEIHNPDMTQCPMGHTVCANGMAINVTELGNFGEMLLNGGEFRGKRILPKWYVYEMLSPKVKTPEPVPPTGTEAGAAAPATLDYGYQIWLDPVHDAAFLWGIFGQYCIIVPKKNLIITTMGLVDSDGGSNGAYNFSPFRKALWDLIEEL